MSKSVEGAMFLGTASPSSATRFGSDDVDTFGNRPELKLIVGGLAAPSPLRRVRRRTLRLIRMALLVWIGLLVAVLVFTSLTGTSIPRSGSQTYVVRPGDTLWSIATSHSGGGDPRILVAQLERELSGSTSIYVGERLSIPSSKG